VISAQVDASEVVDGLHQASRGLAESVERDLKGVAQKIQAEARAKHRYRNRTGSLRNATEALVHQYTLSAQIDDASAPHGKYIHDGTRRWSPDQFLQNAFDNNTDEIDEVVANAVEKDFEKAGFEVRK
jgi:HK97 gp10 family phage protein